MSALLQVMAVAIGSYLIRISMVVALGRITLTDRVQRMLSLIGPAVLAALVAQLLLLHGQELRNLDQWHLAAVAAAGVAWWRKSIAWTLGAGMGALWVLLLVDRL